MVEEEEDLLSTKTLYLRIYTETVIVHIERHCTEYF